MTDCFCERLRALATAACAMVDEHQGFIAQGWPQSGYTPAFSALRVAVAEYRLVHKGETTGAQRIKHLEDLIVSFARHELYSDGEIEGEGKLILAARQKEGKHD